MPLKKQYGWSTSEFLKKFNDGEAGDEQAFFRWYAFAEAINDWQSTSTSIDDLLTVGMIST